MIQEKNLTATQKSRFNLKVKFVVFYTFYFKMMLFIISPVTFIRVLRRLNFFLSSIQHNKFARTRQGTKIDLYVPAFPSKAFFTACNKFAVFKDIMPCTTVLISVTSACRFSCPHCYQKHDIGKDMDINILISTIKKLQDMGIAFFNIEGGEPFLVFERLKQVCRAIDHRSEIWINSTGDGMSIEKLKELKQDNIAGFMFSLHTPEKKSFNEFMGKETAWDDMIQGIQMCREAGFAAAINTCLMKNSFFDGTFEKIMELTKDRGITLIQIIKPKPAGGYLSGIENDFNEEDLKTVKQKVMHYNLDVSKNKYPSISAQIIEESEEMFGCTAGGTDRFYINAKGDVQPCEFVNISYGNITTGNFDEIYKKMRKSFAGGGDCWICEKYSCEIYKEFKENNLKSLPLSPEKSEHLFKNWRRGRQSKFYEKVYKL
ncbi:MAG TPA: radical SAM protein [Bacteroidales bacterium]|nr:MAG: radical SAM protein [Bacteroidetes bacterium GWF2_35_48]OFY97359.1 MAG: radical SAM protein [Bacteroidetes bacterium RIFOXYC12_FULL_35_7]HBX51216.1 radical SAM protein [Bacteroidales bacterium]